MSIIVSDFPDLVEMINTHPEWRRQLVEALFPDVDLAQSMRELKQALKELAQAQARTEQSLREAAEDRLRIETEAAEDRRQIREVQVRTEQSLREAAEDRLRIETEAAEDRRQIREVQIRTEQSLREAAEDRRQIRVRLDVMHQDVAALKGLSYERTIRDIATGIFGIFIRRGKDAKGKISEQLYDAMTAGKISEHEFRQVMAIDLLWEGLLHISGLKVVLTIEASWRAEPNDIERAVTRANILKTIEINALPVVAGNIWDDELVKLALERGVVVVKDKLVHKDTWDSALQKLSR